MISFLDNFGVQSSPIQSSFRNHEVTVGNDAVTRARSNDPQSSKEAAINAAKFANSHAGRILFALHQAPLTAKEIGFLTGLSVVQIDRRVHELRKSGRLAVVQDGGKDAMRDGFRILEAVI